MNAHGFTVAEFTSELSEREANSADVDAIARLHADSWRRTYRGMLRDSYLDGDLVADRRAVWSTRLASPRRDQRVVVLERKHDAAAASRSVSAIDGFVCAFLLESERESESEPRSVFVDNLHVSRPLQGQGAGTRLLLAAARFALAHRTTPQERIGVHLWVLEKNTRAARFYEGRGAIQTVAERKDLPDGSVSTLLRYEWPDAERLASVCAAQTARNAGPTVEPHGGVRDEPASKKAPEPEPAP